MTMTVGASHFTTSFSQLGLISFAFVKAISARFITARFYSRSFRLNNGWIVAYVIFNIYCHLAKGVACSFTECYGFWISFSMSIQGKWPNLNVQSIDLERFSLRRDLNAVPIVPHSKMLPANDTSIPIDFNRTLRTKPTDFSSWMKITK